MAEKVAEKRINDALDLLDEMAKDKQAELRDLVSEKYANLKSALGGIGDRLNHRAHESYEHGKEKANELASRMDERVRKNMWPYLGGTALGFLVLGYIFGRSKK